MIDVVFPQQNEQEFFATAKRLGYDGLILVYPSEQSAERMPLPPKGLKASSAVLAGQQTAFQLRKKGLTIFVQASENDKKILERGFASVLFGSELVQAKEYAHQRGSGLNQVLCSLANKNKATIGFGLSNILSAGINQRAQLLGRIMQNIRLCKKYKVKTIIGSFAKSQWQMRSPHDLQAFFTMLGMHPADAKQSLQGRTA
jgi:RNase P/RNase MRP subunit p30